MAVAGVVLAAGLSRRFGRNKLLEPFRGRPLLRWTVEAALQSRLSSVTVVLGHQQDQVRDALSDLAGEPRLTLASNPSYADGQSTSVVAGLSAIPSGSDGAMFLVADQPLLDDLAIDRLIAAFEAADGGICYPVCGGRRGNPVIFAASFFPELRQLRGDGGGRAIIDAHGDACVPVEFSSASLFRDIDLPADIGSLSPGEADAAGGVGLVQALGLERSRVISLCGSGGKTSLMSELVRAFAPDPAERVLAVTTTKMGLDEMQGPWRACQAANAADLLAMSDDNAGPILAYHHLDSERGRLRGFSTDAVDDVARSGRFTRILVEADGSRRRPLKAPDASEPVFPATTDTVVAVAGLNGLGCPLDDDTVFRPDRWSALTGLAPSSPVTPESLAQVISHPDGLMRQAPAQARRLLFLNQADTPSKLATANRVLDELARLGGHAAARAVIGHLRPEPRVCAFRTFGAQTS